MTEYEQMKFNSIELQMQRLVFLYEEQQKALSTMLLNKEIPAFCTLEQACKLKGGSDVSSIQKKFWQQPCCGARSVKCNGRKVWPRNEIIRWLNVTDDNLEEYAASLGIDISKYFYNGKSVQTHKEK